MTHVLALEHPNGKMPTAESIELLAEGWKKGKYRNNKLGLELYLRLKALGDRESALRVLYQGIESSPENDVYRNLLAREMLNYRQERSIYPPERPAVSAPDGAGASGTVPAPPAAPSRE